MANRCRLPDMQICITATLEQQLHLRFNVCSRRWRGQAEDPQRRTGKKATCPSARTGSDQWTNTSRTAWQSVDVEVGDGQDDARRIGAALGMSVSWSARCACSDKFFVLLS
jgi:hypothetical protein